MKNKVLRNYLILTYILLVFTSGCLGVDPRIYLAAKSQETFLNFYGQAVDQFDEPVVDANVIITIAIADPEFGIGADKKIVKTDENGLFEFHGIGHDVGIYKIEKDLYEFLYDSDTKRNFEYKVGYQDRFTPDKDNPVVFYLRKKGEVAFLVKQEFGLMLMDDEFEKEQDFTLLREWIDADYKLRREKHNDLRIIFTVNEDRSGCEINIISLDPDSGIIMSDELLYEAPESGYEPQVDIVFDELPVQSFKKYLYVKSRQGQAYSRIECGISARKRMRIGMRAYTNPAGSRNLEYDNKYNFKEKQHRMAEVKRRYDERARKGREKRRLRLEEIAKRKAAEKEKNKP